MTLFRCILSPLARNYQNEGMQFEPPFPAFPAGGGGVENGRNPLISLLLALAMLKKFLGQISWEGGGGMGRSLYLDDAKQCYAYCY